MVLPDGPIRWIASRGRVEFDGTGNPVLMPGVSSTTPRADSQVRTVMASPPVHENTQARMRWDRGIKWGKMSAAGSVLIVPLTVLFYPIQRFLIRTLSPRRHRRLVL